MQIVPELLVSCIERTCHEVTKSTKPKTDQGDMKFTDHSIFQSFKTSYLISVLLTWIFQDKAQTQGAKTHAYVQTNISIIISLFGTLFWRVYGMSG